MQSVGEQISDADIKNDGLVEDMTIIVNACKREATDNRTMSVNSTALFGCTAEKLNGLKGKYSYLN
jgi:hypothetical protein